MYGLAAAVASDETTVNCVWERDFIVMPGKGVRFTVSDVGQAVSKTMEVMTSMLHNGMFLDQRRQFDALKITSDTDNWMSREDGCSAFKVARDATGAGTVTTQ